MSISIEGIYSVSHTQRFPPATLSMASRCTSVSQASKVSPVRVVVLVAVPDNFAVCRTECCLIARRLEPELLLIRNTSRTQPVDVSFSYWVLDSYRGRPSQSNNCSCVVSASAQESRQE